MSVERTDIVRGRNQEKFSYKLYLNFEDDLSPQSKKRQAHFFESRATILDRPAWRDDVVILPVRDPADEVTMRVFVKGTELFDTVVLPNVLEG